MADANSTIVSFGAAPVVEVVAGVAFDQPAPELGPLLSAFWKERLREHFPFLDQQSPYLPSPERFPRPRSTPGIEFGVGVTPIRLWARSGDRQELLQLQPGYFACNWRKVKPHNEYDRWRARRDAFSKWYSMLRDYLAAEGAGEIKPTQCEVTYINHITAGTSWSNHSDFNKVFNVKLAQVDGYQLEQGLVQMELLLAEGGSPHGRLHVKIIPAFAKDGTTPLYVLELTARGAPMDDTSEGILSFLDRGREAIDRTFVAMTTDLMHREWEIRK